MAGIATKNADAEFPLRPTYAKKVPLTEQLVSSEFVA
jgi:hypothetical protein